MNTINGTGLNSLAQLFQQLSGAGGGDNDGDEGGGFKIPSATGAGGNPLAALMGGGDNDGDEGGVSGVSNLLSGLNTGNSALYSAMMAQVGALSGTSSPAQAQTNATPQNQATSSLQSLLDAMFNKASNGTGKMDQTQFTNLIKQMDPNGTSGVDVAKLFAQLDPNKTGVVTQAQFDAAFSGTAGATKADATAIKTSAGNLMDAMFNTADTNGIFQLNVAQFGNLVNQMDPGGTGKVKAANLFSALDPNQTGLVSKTQFDSAVNAMLNPNTAASASTPTAGTANSTGKNTISAASMQFSMQLSIMQYQATTSLIGGSIGGGNNGINSLLNITV